MNPNRDEWAGQVGRLECGPERGTAFLLDNDLAITCRHCVLPHLLSSAQIVIHLGGQSIVAVPTEPSIPEEHDSIILKLASPFADELLLPLTVSYLPRGIAWETFGFPQSRGQVGMSIRGQVARSLHSDFVPRDVELACEGSDLPLDYRGFSGAPVVVAGVVRAMIQRRIDGGIGAISFARLQGYLETAGVQLRAAQDEEPLAISLKHDLEKTVPNRKAIWHLEELLEGKPTGYLLVSGNPGCGKTLISAGFHPDVSSTQIVGRYFASGHPGSDLPPAYHGRLSTFAQWLSNEASLRSPVAIGVRNNSTVEEFIKSIPANLRAIGAVAKGINVLLIDGVDSGESSNTEFIDHLPRTPPPGLAIILLTTNANTLKSRFQHLQIQQDVAVPPLPHFDCERIVIKRLPDRLTPSQVALVAAASSGHPLTLSYLIEEVKAALDRGDVDPINTIGSQTEGLTGYYSQVWQRLLGQSNAQYLLALIARTRHDITEDTIAQIIQQIPQSDFLTSIARVKHLLRTENGVMDFYHESFRQFVLSQSELLEIPIQKVISSYCETTPDSGYSVANVIYHRLRSGDDNKRTSELCNQAWADKAATLCIQPELVMSDIEAVLADRLNAGDLSQCIRLLLLKSRTTSRYNRVYAQFAAKFALATIGLRGPRNAIGFVLRGGLYLCSIDETLELLRSLSLRDYDSEAWQLFQEFRKRCWLAYEQGKASYHLLIGHMRATCILAAGGFSGDAAFALEELNRLFRLLRQNYASRETETDAQETMLSQIRGILAAEYLWRGGYAPCNPTDAVELTFLLKELDSITWEQGQAIHLQERPRNHLPATGLRIFDRAEVQQALNDIPHFQTASLSFAEMIASQLIRGPNSFSHVTDLYNRAVPLVTNVSIRSENGVDASLLNCDKLLFSSEVYAFTSLQSLADRVTSTTRHAWETRFTDAANCLGKIRGRGFRARALNQAFTSPILDQLTLEFLPLVRFTLMERSTWEDSYHIPELLTPRLYFWAALTIVQLEPESSTRFADVLLDQLEKQHGLYTEGYQRTLETVAQILGSTQHGIQAAADLRRKLRDHIVRYVYARQERVSGLLNCAIHFVTLDSIADAEVAYEEAVYSSQGPSWYKEDQFRLLLDAIESVSDRQFSLTKWRKTIEILAFASGESTFQRYVRHQKEELVRHLARQGLLAEALTTYFHYVVPSFKLQLMRVRRVGIDMTSDVSGDRFGVLEIDEQCGVLALLAGTENASPLKRWALVELFWPWGDDRYSNQFARELCSLLNGTKAQTIGQRFVRMLGADLDPDRREQFIKEILDTDPTHITLPWLELAGVQAPEDTVLTRERSVSTASIPDVDSTGARIEDETDSEMLMPGIFGTRASLEPLKIADEQANERIARGDLVSARNILVTALLEGQKGGWDIWEGHPDANAAIKKLFNECGPVGQALRDLSNLITTNEHTPSWKIAEKLLSSAALQLDFKTRLELFSHLAEHIECLVKAERDQLSVEEELKELPVALTPISEETCLETLILSTIDHPNVNMRKRGAVVIEWLARESQIGTDVLLNHLLKDGSDAGKEIAVGILLRLASLNPDWRREIQSSQHFENLKTESNFLAHFMVTELGQQWQGTCLASTRLASTGRKEIRWSEEVSELLTLKSGSLEAASNLAHELVAPLSPSEAHGLFKIRTRAFGGPKPSYYIPFEKEVLYRVFSDVTDTTIRERIRSVMSWNPFWPEAELQVNWAPLSPRILSALQSNESQSCFIVDNNTILHCFEFDPDIHAESGKFTEVLTVLVYEGLSLDHLNLEILFKTQGVHEQVPLQSRSCLAMSQEPSIIRFSPASMYGGDMTPARLSTRMAELARTNNAKRVSWRNSRSWDQWSPGRPLSFGTATLVESVKLDNIVGYKLIWVVMRGNRVAFVVDPKQNRIERGPR